MDLLNQAHAPAQDAWRELSALASSLEPDLRRRIGEGWARAAQYEHASVASFNRFSLQLLALGAPPMLLESAQRATLDEIKHARLCFAVASAYIGQPLGPGPLHVEASAFADFSLQSILHSAVVEGCVGETLAAAHAENMLEHVQLPVLRNVFEIICHDEATHAALAFQFARWAMQAFGAPARACVSSSFDDALLGLRNQSRPAGASDPALLAHGRESELDRHLSDLRALDEVLEPARAELLAGRDAG